MTRRNALRRSVLTLSMLGLVTLSGCGFTPLYGAQGMSAALDDVSVSLPEHSRAGFLVQERLNDALGRHGDHGSWKLTLDVSSRRIPRGVRVDNVANRYELNMQVDFVLTDAATGKIALKESVTAQATYDSSDQPYAGLAAEQDGEARAAQAAADLIRMRLARYFSARPNP